MITENPYRVSLQLTKHNDEIEIRAESSGGQARCETQLPSESIMNQIAGQHPDNIPHHTIEKIGDQLYKLLMIGDVGKLVFDTLEDGKRFNQSAFFELRFDADQISLTKFPWELIRNELGQYLVRDGIIDMTRCITYPQPMPSLRKDLHEISLLRVISQPPKLRPITPTRLVVKDMETIGHATFAKIQRKLLIESTRSWGLQFDGHGALLLQCQTCKWLNELISVGCANCGFSLSGAKQIGVLAFEDNGDVDFVSTEEFGSVLYNSGIQLALLLACETARVGNDIIFNCLAPNLILAGVPVVIGMQFPVLDSFANCFANSFYEVLLESGDLLKAIRTARRMNVRGAWYSPSVYLRYKPTELDDKPVFETRQIDTAVPSEVIVGNHFLVKLWIRRPSTAPQTSEELRKTLGISEHVKIDTDMFETDVKFEKVEGREFRRGELLVRLQSDECEIKAGSISLFVDEKRDAPPAIFVVRVNKIGRHPLLFSVWQDQSMIASIIHQVDAVESYTKPKLIVEISSRIISVEKVGIEDEKARIEDENRRRESLEREERQFAELSLIRHRIDFEKRIQQEIERSLEIENRLERLRQEIFLSGTFDEIFMELASFQQAIARIREIEVELEREIRTVIPIEQRFLEYWRMIHELTRRREEAEIFLDTLEKDLNQAIEEVYGRGFDLARILRYAQQAEKELPVLAFLLHVFQVCPMMHESSVLEQMKHFIMCGRCLSYIKENPRDAELHILLKGFIVFCYKEKVIRDLEPDLEMQLEEEYFHERIHHLGADLLSAFIRYLELISPTLERNYLEYKMKKYSR